MKGAIYVLFGALFEVCKSQYVAINPKPSKLNPCDNPSITAPIERFFDLIFTEFHNTPPACVCIQMCAEQPTYCYPNGCLKRTEKKKVEETTFVVNPAPKDNFNVQTKSAMLGVGHRTIMDDFLERSGLLMLHEDTIQKQTTNDLIHRPNPFKELVLKYKKVPKLEMKYNLREQVRNTKSDKLNREKNIDISKARWPSNKHLLHGKSPFQGIRQYRKNDDTKQTKFFVSMFPEYDPSSYNPVHYKKYLTKRNHNNGVNVETLCLYETDTANFTLENLIDNLIESSLDKSKKDTSSSNVEIDNNIVNQEPTTETNINITDISFLLDVENYSNSIINNTAVSIISMNYTNENRDVNKYSHDMNMTRENTFLEMIASMAKEIDKQNKASLEFMERVTGMKSILNDSTSTDKSVQVNATANNSNFTESIVEKTNITKLHITGYTTENIVPMEDFTSTQNVVPIKITTNYKKSKQRILRKHKPRKLN